MGSAASNPERERHPQRTGEEPKFHRVAGTRSESRSEEADPRPLLTPETLATVPPQTP